MHDKKTTLPLNVDLSSTVIIIQEKEAGKDASTRKPFLRHSRADSIKGAIHKPREQLKGKDVGQMTIV